MSKVIDEVRHKIACGQNLFRRSTIEKMLLEYDRLLMRNTALEKNAVEHRLHTDGADVCHIVTHVFIDGTCAMCGFPEPRPAGKA